MDRIFFENSSACSAEGFAGSCYAASTARRRSCVLLPSTLPRSSRGLQNTGRCPCSARALGSMLVRDTSFRTGPFPGTSLATTAAGARGFTLDGPSETSTPDVLRAVADSSPLLMEVCQVSSAMGSPSRTVGVFPAGAPAVLPFFSLHPSSVNTSPSGAYR